MSAANKGMVEAQFSAANAYWAGDGVEKSEVNAVFWYKTAAAGGSRDAKYTLGVLYTQGLGGTAEEIPDAAARAAMGFELYCEAADLGELRSKYNVGLEYLHGTGQVEQDLPRAAEFLTEAAEAGYVPAMVNLGKMFATGLVGQLPGGVADVAKAREWFQKGADLGNEESAEMLKAVPAV